VKPGGRGGKPGTNRQRHGHSSIFPFFLFLFFSFSYSFSSFSLLLIPYYSLPLFLNNFHPPFFSFSFCSYSVSSPSPSYASFYFSYVLPFVLLSLLRSLQFPDPHNCTGNSDLQTSAHPTKPRYFAVFKFVMAMKTHQLPAANPNPLGLYAFTNRRY
jgi:hypothetical protein